MDLFNDFLKEVNEKYPKYKIGFIVTDRDSEFLGDFMKNLELKDIPHIYANAGDKRKTSPIERFNKTIRLYLEKYRILNGKIDNNALENILYAYNNSKNLSTGFTPIEILDDKSKQDKVENHNILLDRENKREILPNGTYVRTLLTISPFQKVKPVWSFETYKIRIYSQSNYQLDRKDGYLVKRPFRSRKS